LANNEGLRRATLFASFSGKRRISALEKEEYTTNSLYYIGCRDVPMLNLLIEGFIELNKKYRSQVNDTKENVTLAQSRIL
jgi:hypothetical protein